ncbi:MAG: PKD-like family lipoprotein [Draconibacterium sp.]
MKKLILYISLVVLAVFPSCYEDLGNYDYIEAEVITVEGIETSYDKVSAIDRITLDPEVSSNDPDAEFEYFWGIYETNAQGYAPKLDTIAYTKSIDYLVTQDAKLWVLVFGAKNIHTGLTKLVNADINVTTEFTRGWYVLKDNGTETDIDQFLTPDTIIPERMAEDVFSVVNGRKLNGKAKQLVFFSSYKSFMTNPSRASNTRTLFALSDKDASAIYIDNFNQIRPLNELFYDAPTVEAPSLVSYNSSTASNYFINNGKLHYIYIMSLNSGVFGAPVLRNNTNDDYHLSQYAIGHGKQHLYFDEVSTTFVSHPMAGTTMVEAKDAATTEMSAINTNKKLLYMGTQGSGKPGVALFQDLTDPDLVILSELDGNYNSLSFTNDTIAPTEKIHNATRVTINQDESMLYFETNGEIWSRNRANRNEQKQFTAPAGEEITFIRHLKYTTASDAPFNFNYVMIATTNGGHYKVYFFQKSSGNLASEPDFVLEGEGQVGDVIYISPKVSDYTYIGGY